MEVNRGRTSQATGAASGAQGDAGSREAPEDGRAALHRPDVADLLHAATIAIIGRVSVDRHRHRSVLPDAERNLAVPA